MQRLPPAPRFRRHEALEVVIAKVGSSPQSLAQETLAERVLEALGGEILSGRLLPGQRVDLSHYAGMWDVSITPVRDAAKQLEARGFLEVKPRRGVFVSAISSKEVKDVFDVRIALESAAVRLATPRITPARAEKALNIYLAAGKVSEERERDRLLARSDLLVHNLALEYCGNDRLRKLMEGMMDVVRWYQKTIIQNLNEPYVTTLPEHVAICEALRDGDADRAAAAMANHLAATSARIQDFLASQPPSD